MEKEYIEREAARDYINNGTGTPMQKLFADLCVLNTPAADVVEVRHGVWKLNKDGSGTCNQCGSTQKNVWDYDRWQNYCGVCGAKMDGNGE